MAGPETADVEALRLQVSELQQKVEQLQDENKELRSKVRNPASHDLNLNQFRPYRSYGVSLFEVAMFAVSGN